MRCLIFKFIQQQFELDEFLDKISKQKVVAIDTEFVRAHEYRPKLCLLQIMAGEKIAIIDTLAKLDFTGITNLLINPKILKLIHGCEQDAEVLHHTFKIHINPIYDTQIAAAFLGEEGLIGYAELVEKSFKQTIVKDYQYSNWDKRPLPKEMLEYAASDVLFLKKIYDLQKKLLTKNKIISFILDESLEISSSLDSKNAIRKSFFKLYHKVKANNLELLMKLILLRESAALNSHMRRQLIINDEHLCKYVDQQYLTKKGLEKIGIDSFSDLQYMELPNELVQFVERLRRIRSINRNIIKERIETLKDIVINRAKNLGIYPNLVCSKQDAILYLVEDPQCRLLSGWRKDILGNLLDSIEKL